MSEACSGGSPRGAIGPERDRAPALGAADWLSLVAAPTFAVMALLTGLFGGDAANMVCGPVRDAWPLSGMVPMYLLMSAFHSAPWVRLLSSRRNHARPAR